MRTAPNPELLANALAGVLTSSVEKETTLSVALFDPDSMRRIVHVKPC